jgi:hypothetical protein
MVLRNVTICLALFYGIVFCGDSVSAIQEKSVFIEVKANKFLFSYKVDGENFVARVTYPTAGWVAVGFNPTKMMKGANFIIGSVVNGKTVISDEFGDSEDSHAPDTVHGGKYNVVNGSVTTDKGTTTMSFTIPLKSGDDKDAVLEKGKPIKLIFAAGKKPDQGTQHNALAKATITL